MIHTDDDLRQFAANGAAPLPAADAEGRVEFEGARIWYATYGTGAPVVLLHGAFDNSEDWGFQIPALVAAGHRAILIDNRGRGRSTLGHVPVTYELMAREVLAVMDALEIPKFAVVGWSDGATIGLILAMKHPARIDRVFAFGGSMDLKAIKELPANEPKLARVFGRAKKDYVRLSETPDDFAIMAKAVKHMMATEPDYRAADLATIRVPVAIVVGEHDEFIKPEHSEYLARTIPGASLRILPYVSHFAMLQRPDRFNEAMVAFLYTG
jgi:pimeloyl-ACP methyl ester carboxylesterase